MRAMVYRAYGGPDQLRLETMPVPAPSAGQVLVRVVASSINPVDWKMASGAIRLYMPAHFPCIPGFDVAGEVVEIGAGVTAFAPGARVHARIAKPGTAAEYAVADATLVAPLPDGMDFVEGAALPLAGMTALQGLRDRGRIPMTGASARVLIVGASGGVGHLAVQIAVAAGADVTGVCSTRNVARVAALGARHVVDYTQPDPYRGLAPFDVVYDCVAGDPSPHLPRVAAGGRYLSCVPVVSTFLRMLANPFVSRSVHPVMLRASGDDLAFLDRLWTAKKLRAIVDDAIPLEDLAAGWQRSRSGRTVGKLIVRVADA